MSQYYNLSHPQKRILQMEEYFSNTPINNITGITFFEGQIDITVLDKAINLMIKSNDGVRLRLFKKDGKVKQYVYPYEYKKLDVYDFFNDKDGYEEWLSIFNSKLFNIFNSDLYYAAIIKNPNGKIGFYYRFHHIITDAWSTAAATSMAVEIYTSLKNNKEYNFSRPSYTEYILSEENYKKSLRYERDKTFWNEQFKDIPDVVGLSQKTLNSLDVCAKRKTFKLSTELTNEILNFSKESSISNFNLMFGVLAILTNRYTNKKDFTLGTVVLNRTKREKDMQGMFITTLPIKFQVDSNSNFMEFLQYSKSIWYKCLKHEKFPYDELLSELREKNSSIDKLYNVVMSYQNAKVVTECNGEKHMPKWLFNNTTSESLIIHINDRASEGQFIIDYDYQTQAFDEWEINNIHNHLIEILKDGMRVPEKNINKLNMLLDTEKSEIIKMLSNSKSSFPKELVIHEIFEEMVEKFPDKVAISLGEKRLTYNELNEKANIMAHVLKKYGVERETIVGILLNKSIEMVISILGILKAGGTYLPIDVDYPNDRQEYMLHDSGTKILISESIYYSSIKYDGKVISIDEELKKSYEIENIEINNKPNDAAYIIYTSGSTGKPKGVMITHRNVVRLMKNEYFQFDFNEDDIWTVAHSFCFDFSVWEMYGALLYGGQLVVVPKEIVVNPAAFLKVLKDNNVTVLNQTPQSFYSLSNKVVEDNLKSLKVRYVIFGGESLSPIKLRKWREIYKKTKLINMYGITETTVHVTFKELSDNDIELNVSNVGKPIPTLSMYLMDRNLNVQPFNVPGEICVSGEGVAKGYLNRPELNKEKFVVNPLNEKEILYRSGDLGRLLPTGDVEYLGRIDKQIKIRGFRVELGEIENKLLDISYIKDAVVLCKVDANGSNILCAYVSASKKLNISDIREQLLETLPLYMIPSYYVQLEKIPCTSNGKVDRKVLLEIEDYLHAESEYEEAKDYVEEKLVEAWCSVLKIKEIGRNDNFFDLGGDSIKAIQITSRLQRYNLKLDVKYLLKYPILCEVSKYVEKIDIVEIDQGPVIGEVPLTPIQIEFFENNKEGINHFNHEVLLKCKDNLDENYVKKVFKKIIEHHDALRMKYIIENEKVIQVNSNVGSVVCDLKVFDLQSSKDCLKDIEEISREINKSIKLDKGPLVKLGIFNTNEGDFILIAIHHLVVDGVSWRIILEDFENALSKANSKEKIQFQNKTTSFKEWSNKLQCYANEEELCNEIEYWSYITNKNVKEIAVDNYIEHREMNNSKSISTVIPKEETELLLYESNKAFKTEINDLLISALVLSIDQWTGLNRFFINMESHGRTLDFEGVDISRTVGWFTATYPLYVEYNNEELSNFISEIKETIRKVPNKGIGYGILKYLSSREERNKVNFDIHPQISFNYLGQVDNSINTDTFTNSDFVLRGSFGDKINCSYNLDINVITVDCELKVIISYNDMEYNSTSIKELAELYKNNLITIIEYCVAREQVAYTLSDFSDSDLSQDELDEISSLFS